MDAGHGEALVDFLLEQVVDFLAAAAQSDFVVQAVDVVVGKPACHLAQRCIALYAHEGLEGGAVVGRAELHAAATARHAGGIDVEDGAVGILHLPHEHHAYHHRVAHLVVDLYGLHVHVVEAQRHLAGCHEGIYPKEAGLAECAAIVAEEYHHAGLVGLLHKEAAPEEQPQQREKGNRQSGHAE